MCWNSCDRFLGISNVLKQHRFLWWLVLQFSNSPICSCSQNVSFALTCDAYQRKAGSIPHGRRLVSVIVLNGQNLQIMIEVYIYIVFINLLLLWLSWWSRTTDCISPCTKLFLCKYCEKNCIVLTANNWSPCHMVENQPLISIKIIF